jgi:hypothetical protein
MRETAHSQHVEAEPQVRVVHTPTSLATTDERLARMWALTAAQRLQEARHGRLTLAEMLRWASRATHEVPLVNNEFFFIAALAE